MSLDLSKLQKVRHQSNGVVARCPACAEEGHDRHGNHLFIYPDGHFGCVRYSGEAGLSHRQKIFALVGTKDSAITTHIKTILVKNINIKVPEVLESNVLGRLGRLQPNPIKPRTTEQSENKEQGGVTNKTEGIPAKIVPTVPKKNITFTNPEDVVGFYVGRQRLCIYCIGVNEEVTAVRKNNFIMRGYTEDGFAAYECDRCGGIIN